MNEYIAVYIKQKTKCTEGSLYMKNQMLAGGKNYKMQVCWFVGILYGETDAA